MMTDPSLPRKIGLYLHIPFCVKKCGYCDFYSQSDYSLTDAYLSALLREAALYAERYGDRRVDTVYIGGGTPSSLTAAQLALLLSSLKDLFHIEDGAEVTLEANPATLTADKLAVLKQNGVNRLSIGLQSACDSELHALSRIHSFATFEENYRLAKEYIENVSIDLMFGIPDQTERSFRETLFRVCALAPSHISLYALKIESGTPFAAKEDSLALPSEDVVSDMYLYACDFLASKGYHQYEISNFARQGCLSKHNMRYWKREEYLGLGPSAHSFADGRRYANARDIKGYMQALSLGQIPPLSEDCVVSAKEALEEEIMLGLRLSEGIDLAYLEEKSGYTMKKNATALLQFCVENGFMKKTGTVISLTPRGFLVSNTIISELLPD